LICAKKDEPCAVTTRGEMKCALESESSLPSGGLITERGARSRA
jgi:hypothetical protein